MPHKRHLSIICVILVVLLLLPGCAVAPAPRLRAAVLTERETSLLQLTAETNGLYAYAGREEQTLEISILAPDQGAWKTEQSLDLTVGKGSLLLFNVNETEDRQLHLLVAHVLNGNVTRAEYPLAVENRYNYSVGFLDEVGVELAADAVCVLSVDVRAGDSGDLNVFALDEYPARPPTNALQRIVVVTPAG